MWRRGGRSSALDRAQGLLAARRSGGGAGGAGGTQGHGQGRERGPVPSRPAGASFSDLSEESSVSLAAELRPFMVGEAGEAGEAGGAEEDARPRSSLEGRSRFLKKPPPPTSSSGGSRSQAPPEPSRCVPSSQRSSQAAVLSRLALIESRVRIRKPDQDQDQVQDQDQDQRGMNPASELTSDTPAAAATQSPVTPQQPSGDHRLKGSHFLKSRAANAGGAAAADGPDTGVRLGMAAGRARREPVKVVSSVSLESDEEDMRRLLGDPLDSPDDGLSHLGRRSPVKLQDKTSSRRVRSSPPPSSPSIAASPHRSADSPPRRQASPFRFTGQAQARFSPSVPSPLPSPHPAGRPGSSRSASSASGHREALSLEELFPAGPDSSSVSSVSSGDFMINVKSLDELVPTASGFAEETPGNEARRDVKQRETKPTITATTAGPQQLQRGEEEEEGGRDYQSDFESESPSDQSASQVSEDVPGGGDQQEAESEVRSEESDSSLGKTLDDCPSTLSHGSRTASSRTRSPESWTGSRTASSKSRDSESWTGSRTGAGRARRAAVASRAVREAAVQTHPDPLAHTWWSGVAAPTYLDASPLLAHTLRAERVEALAPLRPAVLTVGEVVRQQLEALTRSVQLSRLQHSRLLQSLEPPDYRYTTLEDTLQMMKKRRAPRPSMEAAPAEMRDCHCT
ncbi:uncharacterized protein C19orf44 homolog isoform X1 [Salarias fasciatus]|uniref:uncharacterized protein C19orf44 homolog isoform X1 n=1 Tax=Salarias fasciatus TaxID=181472 RepID=UPI001176C568|nr:uncharacterized protein C19orf44 homolog isoform X1 [Salarias fasciatus]